AKPGRMNAHGKHSRMIIYNTTKEMKISFKFFPLPRFPTVTPRIIETLKRDLMAKWTSKSRAAGATGAKQTRSGLGELRPPVHNTASPEYIRDWPIDSLAKRASD